MRSGDSEKQYTEEYFIRVIVENILQGIGTSLPAQVVAFNVDEQRVDVQPLIRMKKLKTAESFSRAVVSNVPVSFPNFQKLQITFPISPGDQGILVYSHRDLSLWKSNGNEQDAPSNASFRPTDCFFIPGITAGKNKIENYDPENLTIIKDNKKIIFGDGIIDAPDFELNLKRITASEDVVAKGISLVSHTHSGKTLTTTATVGSSGTPGQINGDTDVPK